MLNLNQNLVLNKSFLFLYCVDHLLLQLNLMLHRLYSNIIIQFCQELYKQNDIKQNLLIHFKINIDHFVNHDYLKKIYKSMLHRIKLYLSDIHKALLIYGAKLRSCQSRSIQFCECCKFVFVNSLNHNKRRVWSNESVLLLTLHYAGFIDSGPSHGRKVQDQKSYGALSFQKRNSRMMRQNNKHPIKNRQKPKPSRDYPPASEARGEFRKIVRLAIFSECPSVCNIFWLFLLIYFYRDQSW